MRRAFLRDQRGGVSILAAASSSAIIGFAAVAIDLGSIFVQSRQLQGIADLAALAAARDLPNAEAAARATAAANGWNGDLEVEVVTGAYDADPARAAAARFVAGAGSPNAVKVTLRGKADLFFGQVLLGRPTTDIDRTATAARAEFASFSLGSRLASLNGGVANALLTQLTGSSVSLSVMDYNALASADVDLFRYMDALATSVDLEGAAFDTVLASDVSTGKALTVLADLLDDDGEDSAAAAVRAVATAAGDATPAQLDKLLDLGPYGTQDHVAGASGAGVAVSALDLTGATLLVANGGRQVQLDLGSSIPGLADVDAWIAIGERPNHSAWLTVASDGSTVIRTAQTRIYAEARVGAGSGVLASIAQLKLPIYIEAASAEAKLQSLDCGARTTVLSVKPSIGDVWIGEVDRTRLGTFTSALTVSSGTIISSVLMSVKASAHAQLGGATWQSVSFSDADVKAGTVKTVSTGDTVTALADSVTDDLSLDVSLLGLGLLLNKSNVTTAIGGLLSAAAPSLDGVLNSLTSLLGVRLGEADVRVNGLRCKEAALVA